MANEWCEYDPPMPIHHKGDSAVEAHITFFGLTEQEIIDAMKAPQSHINKAGDLEVHLNSPDFPWACEISVLWEGEDYSTLTLGTQDNPLEAKDNFKVAVPLPSV